MSEFISNIIVNRMILFDVIKSSQKEEYQYSMQVLIEKITGYFLICLTAIILGTFIQTVMFICSYASIRKYAGGYHCGTSERCMIISVLISLFSVSVMSPIVIKHELTCNILLIISMIFVFIYAPVNNPDMNWSIYEYKEMKKLSRIVICAWILIFLVSAVIKVPFRILVYFDLGIINATISIMIAKITKQEVKCNER